MLMVALCRDFLLREAQTWGLPARGEWTFLLHNNYHPHCSNMNLLWFRNGERFPRVVTKVFHEPELPGREFRNQSRAWSYVPESVPKPLHYGPHGGRFWALWMEGVPGFPIAPRQGNDKTMLSMVDTVSAMHTALRQKAGVPDQDRYRRMVLEPARTVARFGSLLSVRDGCEALVRECPASWFDTLPVILQHGDLFLSNMLTQGDRWYILDWESLGEVDLPFYDLLTVLFSWVRADGETPDEWNTALRKQIPALLQRYAIRTGVPASHLRQLLPLTLVNWFHLQWRDGRAEFTRLMYRSIAHFFEHRNSWENTFIPA